MAGFVSIFLALQAPQSVVIVRESAYETAKRESRALGVEIDKELEAIVADVLVIVAMDDRVVTPHPALKFAELDGARTVTLDSGCGHGASRCESQTMNSALHAFLASDKTAKQ